MLNVSNSSLRLITYIQISSICLANLKCKDCNMWDGGCKLLSPINNINLTKNKVYSITKASEYCNKYDCTTCPYIANKFDPTVECDFKAFLSKLGVKPK